MSLVPQSDTGVASSAWVPFVLGLLALPPTPLVAQPEPRLEPATSCPMDLPEELASGVECGWMVVPERYERPGSRTVRLGWARARATGPNAEPDPVMHVFGGPGASALERTPGVLRSASWQRVRRHRDILFLDLRGAGYSDPAVCTSVDDVVAEHDILVESSEALDTLLVRAVEECADPATNGGYDPAAYNSSSAARDLDEFRRLLGYERWNVYGVSYGGRIAQALMRDRPRPIRSVVLDVPAPVGRWSRTLALREALDELFGQCRANSECDSAYPDLEARFERLLERLDTDPVTLRIGAGDPPEGHFVMTREHLVRFVNRSLFLGVTPPLLPALIWEASEGRDQALLGFLPEILEGPRRSTLAEGLALSIICYDTTELSPEYLRQIREEHPLLDLGGWWDARADLLCDRLHSGRATEAELGPVDTGLPTLVLGGGLDPAVAQSSVRETAASESGATLAMAMSAGHGIRRLPCVGGLVAGFFEDPSAPLDLSCLEEHVSVPFVTDVRPVAGMAHFSTFVGIRSSGAPLTTGGRATPVWLAASTLILLLAPLIWGVLWLWRHARTSGEAYTTAESRALWLAVATCGVGVLWTYFFLRGINRTLAVSERLLAVGVLEDPALVRALPWLLTVLAAALVVTAGAAWWRGWWGRWLRVHYGLVACGAGSLAFFVWFWGLV